MQIEFVSKKTIKKNFSQKESIFEKSETPEYDPKKNLVKRPSFLNVESSRCSNIILQNSSVSKNDFIVGTQSPNKVTRMNSKITCINIENSNKNVNFASQQKVEVSKRVVQN